MTLESRPESVLQGALIPEIVDLYSFNKPTPGSGDEDDTPPAVAENRFRQLLRWAESELMVAAFCLGVGDFVGEELVPSRDPDIADTGVVAHGVGFIAENLGLVESQPGGRSPPLEPTLGASDRDAVPVAAPRDLEILEVIQNGDENFTAVT
ncbi:MAG: hypothetical protein MUQ10_10155 [Anaerolineae bacterium]|nr:hypothetical protein [Anaerolineae bacterium]